MSLRSTHLLAMALCMSIAAHAQILINGRSIVHDALAGQWVCTVPDSLIGTDCEAVITIPPTSSWREVTIDDVPVTGGQSVWLTPLDGTTPHVMRAMTAQGAVEGNLYFTCLPVLTVQASLSTLYQPATLVLHHPDSVAPINLQGRIKWRGHSTLQADRHKRNFHFKLEDEQGQKQNVKLLDMRSDNSWILDAGQVDLSRVRNLVAHELWLDMAAKPYYADREPKARSACRGQFVELFVNGNYEGIYTLMEAMDRKQMKLTKYETDTAGLHTIHGQMWKGNQFTTTTTFQSAPSFDNTQESWDGFDTVYPDMDDVSPTDYTPLYNAVKLAATAYDSKWRREVKDYFDLPVMRDYIILIQSLLAIDNMGKNIYWCTYDTPQDKKLTLAVWDLDCTVGQDWTNKPFRPANRVGPERSLTIGVNALWRMNVLLADFHNDLIERYHQLRKGLLHTDSLTLRYTRAIDRLIHAGAAQRESHRWDGDTDIGERPLDWQAEKEYIADWLKRRLKYLDENTFAQAGLDDIVQDVTSTRTITCDILGRVMPQGYRLPPGIYVRNGKKIVIR